MERIEYTGAQIKEKVSQILSENYFDAPPVDVFTLVKNYGINVDKRKFPVRHNNVSGFIVTPETEDGAPIFVVNKDDTEDRQKFTVAHEFGHWMLHRKELEDDPALSILYRSPLGRESDDKIEIEANQFAAQLLVPDTMLQDEHDKNAATSDHRKALAKKFGVGQDIIGFRLGLQGDESLQELDK